MERNAAYRANIPKKFYKHLNYDVQKYKHPDLSPSRIRKDQDAVDNILGILETTLIDPLIPLPLMCILTGVVANKNVTKDMFLAETLVKLRCKNFLIFNYENRELQVFLIQLKKSNMKKVKPCKVNSKIFPLQETNDLFAKISFVAQIRSFDLRSIFKFSLGPLPWAKSPTKYFVSLLRTCWAKYLQLEKRLIVPLSFLTITSMHQSKA